jgi:hypothetical protein
VSLLIILLCPAISVISIIQQIKTSAQESSPPFAVDAFLFFKLALPYLVKRPPISLRQPASKRNNAFQPMLIARTGMVAMNTQKMALRKRLLLHFLLVLYESFGSDRSVVQYSTDSLVPSMRLLLQTRTSSLLDSNFTGNNDVRKNTELTFQGNKMLATSTPQVTTQNVDNR